MYTQLSNSNDKLIKAKLDLTLLNLTFWTAGMSVHAYQTFRYTELLWVIRTEVVISIHNYNVKKVNYLDDIYYMLYIHRLCVLLICEYIIYTGYFLGERRSLWIFFRGTAIHCVPPPLHHWV